MLPHPLSGDLERFVRGALSCPDRRRVIAHLVRGCPDCGAALARYAGFVSGAESAASYDALFQRAFQRAQRAMDTRCDAAEVLAALLSGEASSGAAGDEARVRRRGGVPQVAALIEASRAQRHDDPDRMLRLAYLACCVAERLSEPVYGERTVADFRALAWAELGNAYRVADDLHLASRALDSALYWINRGSHTPFLRARLADLFASLFINQRRFAAARKLLAEVHDVYAVAGDQHLAGRALISAGHLAISAAAPEEALPLLHRGLSHIDYRRDPQLAIQTLQTMIWCLTDLGEFRAARRQLWRTRALFTTHARRLDLLRLRWLEGRVYAGIGDFARAEVAFQDTRSGFAQARQIYPAALAALDLAALWARQRRNSEIRDLAGELVGTFRALGIAREAIATLLVLQRACDLEGLVVDRLIEAAAAVLRELQRRPVRLPA